MAATVPGPITTPSAARPSRTVDWAALRSITTRRKLQLALGFIWLIDAALQYQPYMFGRDFVTQTIEPAASGTPYIVEHPALWAAHFMIHHITVYNAFFATIQLVIALALFYRPTVRIGLAISVVWSIGVWWLAEGIGGITAGGTAFTGAPGAVIVYAFIAVLVWPGGGRDVPPAEGRSIGESGPLGTVVPKIGWAAMWLGFAALGLEAANRSPSAFHDMVIGMSDGEASWIKTLNRGVAAPLAHHGTQWTIALTLVYIVVALAVFVPRFVRPALAVAVIIGAAVWVAEDFGAIFTGSATDVNSGPLIVLFAVTLWPLHRRRTSSAALDSDLVGNAVP